MKKRTAPKRIRVRTENADHFVERLLALGYTAKWLGPGTANGSYAGGCLDPEHCMVHDAYYHPREWGVIETNCPGSVRLTVNASVGDMEQKLPKK